MDLTIMGILLESGLLPTGCLSLNRRKHDSHPNHPLGGLLGKEWNLKTMEVFSCILEFIKYEIFAPVGEWISTLFFRKNQGSEIEYAPFIVSEYLDRMEKANLEILESQNPADKIIILWWGLDGLRLNEDGSLEWISRRKPKPVSQDVFYQPCQTGMLRRNWFDETQSTQAQINALMAQNVSLQLQAASMAQSAYMIRQIQLLQMPGYIPFPMYSALTQCCCNYRP